jgi:hypothetical protein
MLRLRALPIIGASHRLALDLVGATIYKTAKHNL